MFEVTANHIARLSDTDLRLLVGRLCEAAASKLGHSPAGVSYGGHQDAADGGIDVHVKLSASGALDSYIPRAETGFQTKAQELDASGIRDEMCPKGVLHPSIRALGLAAGAYTFDPLEPRSAVPAEMTVRAGACASNDADGLDYLIASNSGWSKAHPVTHAGEAKALQLRPTEPQ